MGSSEIRSRSQAVRQAKERYCWNNRARARAVLEHLAEESLLSDPKSKRVWPPRDSSGKIGAEEKGPVGDDSFGYELSYRHSLRWVEDSCMAFIKGSLRRTCFLQCIGLGGVFMWAAIERGTRALVATD